MVQHSQKAHNWHQSDTKLTKKGLYLQSRPTIWGIENPKWYIHSTENIPLTTCIEYDARNEKSSELWQEQWTNLLAFGKTGPAAHKKSNPSLWILDVITENYITTIN